MNYSRNELIKTEATMNQMRNSLYILVRFMEKNGIKNSTEIFRRMGRNIARTYINYWKPTDFIKISNLKDVITTIYKNVLNSTISIEINDTEKLVIVRDYKCALCKYHYDDVEIAGCEILLGMISEFITLINKESTEPNSIFLDPIEVKESRANGNKSCLQLYSYKISGEA